MSTWDTNATRQRERRPVIVGSGKPSKKVKTEFGEIDLEVPRDRDSTFEPQIVKKRQTVLEGVEDTVLSLYSRGMTTRDVAAQIHDLYGLNISESAVTRVTNKILSLAAEWQSRPLEQTYLILWMDAIHFKVRTEGKVKCKAINLVLGLNQEGKKEVLGMWVSENESASFWMSVLSDLQSRGVEDILIACIDNLKGFAEAIEATFPKTDVQSCVIHQIRNSLKYVSWKNRKEVAKDLKRMYAAPTKEEAENGLEYFSEKWENKYPLIIKSWRTNWDRLTAFFSYPPAIRKIMYTTNIIENFNRCVRKFTKSKTQFPHEDAVLKSVFLAIQQITRKWYRPIKDWGMICHQFGVLFPDRLKLGL